MAGKWLKIVKAVLRPDVALTEWTIDKALDKVDNTAARETLKDVNHLLGGAASGMPVISTLELADDYGLIDTRTEKELNDDFGIKGETIEGFDLEKFKNITKTENGRQVHLKVVQNADGSVLYPIVHNLMGMWSENVLVDGWGKHPKILDIGLVGDEIEYYTKDNSTYAIPYVIAVWNHFGGFGSYDNSMIKEELDGFFDYLSAVGKRPEVSYYGKDPNGYVNSRFQYRPGIRIAGKDVGGQVFKSKIFQPTSDCIHLYDYKISPDGKILKDKTEPEQKGITDMLYLAFVK